MKMHPSRAIDPLAIARGTDTITPKLAVLTHNK